MVEKLKQLLDEIIKEKGQVILFAIMSADELTDKWSVVFSASWINETNRNDHFAYLINKINSHLTPEETSSIARVGVFAQDYYLVPLLLGYQSGQKIENIQINGFFVKEAYIIASNPQYAAKPNQGRLQ
jgi:hypothetical protein